MGSLEPMPNAWNGTNSQIKAAASSSTPVPTSDNPMVTVAVKPTPALSIKASDPPPPRPQVSQVHIGYLEYQRRATTRCSLSITSAALLKALLMAVLVAFPTAPATDLPSTPSRRRRSTNHSTL